MEFPDIVFISMEDWDEVWRRNQFICSKLAKRFPDSKILFVGLPKYILRTQGMTFTPQDLSNITVTGAFKFLPNSIEWGRRFNELSFRIHARNLAEKIGIKNPILWINSHYAVHMIGKMDECSVIYDITDDWTAFPQAVRLTKQITEQDAELCRLADAVIVCSQHLHDLKRSMTQNLHLIPNGVDTEHYAAVLDKTGPIPASLLSCPKPILGYLGSSHSARLDLDLLENMARRLEMGSIVLVGPDMLRNNERQRLKSHKNIYYIGSVPYEKVPDYLRAFDVCIVPHKVTPFTESLNPIKLWEYLASGKPIVSTNVAGFRDFPQFVRIAHEGDTFIRVAQESLKEDPGVAEARRREAQGNSWELRIDAICAVIHDCLRNRAAENNHGK